MNTRTVFVVTLVWALLVVVVVHFVTFPGSVPNFREVSGGGVLLDASPAFTSDADGNSVHRTLTRSPVNAFATANMLETGNLRRETVRNVDRDWLRQHAGQVRD